MEWRLAPMGQAEARAISDWRYPSPYSFYDWRADEEDAALLLDEGRRKGRFFSAFEENELVGFFELQAKDEELVIGLGLRPDLTGGGLGREFLEAGLAYARENFHPTRFRLSVPAFNERAIKVYERAGFSTTRAFDHETNGGVHRFLEMTRPA